MTDLQAAIAAWHHRRFPGEGPEHVALKIASEAGELGDAVLGMVSDGDFGKGVRCPRCRAWLTRYDFSAGDALSIARGVLASGRHQCGKVGA